METKLGNQREMWAKRGHEVDDFTAVKKKESESPVYSLLERRKKNRDWQSLATRPTRVCRRKIENMRLSTATRFVKTTLDANLGESG
jgi:hypothetical protein